MFSVKINPGNTLSPGQPTPQQLAKINRLTVSPLTADQVVVLKAQAANTEIDRDNECFSEAVLQEFADTAIGKNVLNAHTWGGPGFGAIYDANVEQDAGGTSWLMLDLFIPRGPQDAEDMIQKAMSGVWRYVSVGFACASKSQHYIDGRTVGVYSTPAELLEVSAVFLGSQREAGLIAKGMVKSLQQRFERTARPKNPFGYLVPRGV